MNMSIEQITPEKAAGLLALNTDNRNVRKACVAAYARDMAANNWPVTGAAIVLNGNRLLDGQHRLLACVLAGVSFTTVVLRDVDESIHFAIDKGMKRTVGDELKWRGETDVHNLGSALNLLWRYENDAILDPSTQPSVNEIVAFLDACPGLRDSVKQGMRVRRTLPVPSAAVGVVHYLIREAHGEETAEAFVDKLVTGADLVAGDPLLVLRAYITNAAGSRQFRPRREEWLAVVIKAANHWLVGRPIKHLRWRRVGPAAESFPRLIGSEETG